MHGSIFHLYSIASQLIGQYENMEIAKDAEEIELEKLVFGDEDGFAANLKKVDNLYDYSSSENEADDSDENGSDSESDLAGVQDEDLFYIDDGAADEDVEMSELSVESDEELQSDDESAVWHDSDDDKITVDLTDSSKLKKLRKNPEDTRVSASLFVSRLRAQFEKIYPRPRWIDEAEEEDDEEASEDEQSTPQSTNNTNAILKVLAESQQFTQTKQLKLISPNKILITRLKNANHTRPSKSAVQSLAFHSTRPLLVTGGFDRTLRIYHIDGRTNEFVTSLFLKNSPITTCAFSKDVVYAAGRRRYLNKWNTTSGQVEKISRMYGREQFQKSMEYFKVSLQGTWICMVGSSGWCNFLNGETGQWVQGFKVEGTLVDFEISRDESFLVAVNSAGTIWEYDIALGNVVRKWDDDGAIGITKLKLGGPKDRWMAVGSNNGIVNLYDRNTFASGPPKPYKTVENLVTSISSLEYSPDGQLLSIALRAKRDAFRLVHVAQGSVYSNWPTSGTPLGKVTSVAFSPDNQMLAVGNEAGKVTLWNLTHYS